MLIPSLPIVNLLVVNRKLIGEVISVFYRLTYTLIWKGICVRNVKLIRFNRAVCTLKIQHWLYYLAKSGLNESKSRFLLIVGKAGSGPTLPSSLTFLEKF